MKLHIIFISLVFTLLISFQSANSQELYSASYGKSTDPVIIFLHGGPGFNSINFEVSTAEVLASLGYFVIVYDRRGEGRSKDNNAQFTYAETMEDLLALYSKYTIKKATLIGHSFGGIVATKFTKNYPEMVNSILYASAPITMQAVFKTVISSARKFYEKKNDSINLRYIVLLENMDTTLIEYTSYSFAHAMAIGAYSPKKISKEASTLYNQFRIDTRSKKAFEMNSIAPRGFWKNEKYTTEDLTNSIKALQKKSIPMFGLYGIDDGLFSTSDLDKIQELLGEKNFLRIENSSHSVFMDTQKEFLNAIQTWVK